MGKIGGQQTVALLIDTLNETKASVRHHAVEALGKIGEPAVALLIGSLKNIDRNVRHSAAPALTEIGTPQALEAVSVSNTKK
jgi:HEAT repeat protein